MSLILQSLLLGISFAVPIGPTNIEIIRRGVNRGFWAGFIFSLGSTASDIVYILVIALGFNTVSETFAFQIGLGLFGTVFLLILAGLAFYETWHAKFNMSSQSTTKREGLISGFVINSVNPTTLPTWLAMYGILTASPKYEDQILSVHFTVFVMGSVIMGMVYSMIGHLGKKHLNESMVRGVSFISAFILLGFALYFAYNLYQLI